MIFQGDDCVCLHFTCAVAFIQVWMAVVLGSQELMCSVIVGQGRHVTEDHGQVVDFPFFLGGGSCTIQASWVTQVLDVLHQYFGKRPPRIS